MSRKRSRARELAFESAVRLLRLARQRFRSDPDLSRRYVRLAWKLKTKFNLRLPPEFRMLFCRKCLTPWLPGATCRVRIRGGRLTVTCLGCGRIYRRSLKK